MKRMFSLFVDTLAIILQKKSEIVGESFSPTLEIQFVRFYLKYQEIYAQIQSFTDKN